MNKEKLNNMTRSAMLLAIGLVLPFLTGQIRHIGNKLLPMHIPVILCGLICGPKYGLIIGFIMPLMRSLFFGMPVMYPNAVAMAFELATYGAVVGFLYEKSRWHCLKALYRSMLVAMIAGRIVWGMAEVVLLAIAGNVFTMQAYVTGAFINAVPGIIAQLIIIPAVMVTLGRAKVVHFLRK